MLLVGDIMNKNVVTCKELDSVEQVVHKMHSYRVGRVVVIDEGRKIKGLISSRDIRHHSPNRLACDVMNKSLITVSPTDSIVYAYELIQKHRIEGLPVSVDGKLFGIITESQIYFEFGKLTDPLTSLPWPNLLRQQAKESLKKKLEIGFLFVDINNFKEFNKLYGHVIGDLVIQEVANVLKEICHPELDFSCRYGGDEFAVLSVRGIKGLEELAELLREEVKKIAIEGSVSPGEVSVAVGISGGNRKGKRAKSHLDAQINDLINLASKNCLTSKGE